MTDQTNEPEFGSVVAPRLISHLPGSWTRENLKSRPYSYFGDADRLAVVVGNAETIDVEAAPYRFPVVTGWYTQTPDERITLDANPYPDCAIPTIEVA